MGSKNRLKRIFDKTYQKDSYSEEEIQNDNFLKQNKLVEKFLSFRE